MRMLNAVLFVIIFLSIFYSTTLLLTTIVFISLTWIFLFSKREVSPDFFFSALSISFVAVLFKLLFFLTLEPVFFVVSLASAFFLFLFPFIYPDD